MPRRYYACRHCKTKQIPFESWSGISGPHRITPHARRMIVLAGSRCSFDQATKDLAELSHIQVSSDVIRRVCDEEGKVIQRWMNQSPEPNKAFAAAQGVVEFSTDGLKINTVNGWKEIRQSVFCKRQPAVPAMPSQWEDRVLEEPTVRIAICQIAHCDRIGSSWQRLAKMLGIPEDLDLSVIGDGALWIWKQAAKRFKGQDVQWVVDVYHLMLYLYAAVATRGTAAAREWVGQKVIELIELGGPKFIDHLKQLGPPEPSALQGWNKLLNYLEENRDSLWYGRRLKEGLPIGSGLIEGGGKNTLAKRLKINSARWRIQRAQRMGAIRCLQYSQLWETYWDSKAPVAIAA